MLRIPTHCIDAAISRVGIVAGFEHARNRRDVEESVVVLRPFFSTSFRVFSTFKLLPQSSIYFLRIALRIRRCQLVDKLLYDRLLIAYH